MSHPEEPSITAYDLTDPEDRRKSFEAQCKSLRHLIANNAEELKQMQQHPEITSGAGQSTDQWTRISEMRDNLTLAFRHLEDARMRLGKAIQASDGGTSVYKD